MQIIDLVKEGVAPKILDILKPAIEISEWHAARFDCGSIYRLSVALLDARRNPQASFDTGNIETPQWAGREWSQVRHVFVDYPAGVRFVSFEHMGKDTLFWAGHYGAKMAGGEVRIASHQDSRPAAHADG